MSSGELRVSGLEALLELRLPLYEVEHLDAPQRSIGEAFRLAAAGQEATLERIHCEEKAEQEAYVCQLRFQLPAEAERLTVECRLWEATVPNHVHVLRAVWSGGAEQKVFDYGFRRHEFRFRQPTGRELFFSEAYAGALRVLFGPAQLLFLVALATAARSRRELAWMAAAFLISQALTAFAAAPREWQPPARFVEAAGALTIAYLAIETLALPDAGGRWMVAGAMGVFHGLYFSQFLQQSVMAGWRVIAGATAAEALLLAVFAAVIGRLGKDFGARLLVRALAGGLFAIGSLWFLWRLVS